MHWFSKYPQICFAPEYGGDAVSGGGHPSDAPLPATEPIDDAFGQDARGHGNVPGVGVPGSKTNPVLRTAPDRVPPAREEIAQLARRYWEEEGRPEGYADRHWFRAEAELRERAGLQP